jgi:hypothetical protein
MTKGMTKRRGTKRMTSNRITKGVYGIRNGARNGVVSVGTGVYGLGKGVFRMGKGALNIGKGVTKKVIKF